MLRSKLSMRILHLDNEAFVEDLNKNLDNLLRICSTAFVHAAYGRIPVRTGMAAASFRPLAQFLKTEISIEADRKVVRIKGKDYTRDIASGYGKGSFQFITNRNFYRMIFRSSVFHYVLSEKYKIKKIPNTPWKSLSYGERKFVETFNDQVKNHIPQLFKYLKVRTIRIV